MSSYFNFPTTRSADSIKAGKEEIPDVPVLVRTSEPAAKIQGIKEKKKLVIFKNGVKSKIQKLTKSELRDNSIHKDCCFSNLSLMPSIGSHPHNDLVYKFTRMKRYDGFLSSSTVLDTTGSLDFTLGDVADASDFTTLFDLYRIVLIEHWIIPRFSTNTDRAYNPGLLAAAVDYDGGTANYDQLTQYQNVMICSGVEGQYVTWKPGVITTVQASDLVFRTSPWLDIASTAVVHHGLNYAITPTSQVQTYDRIVRYHFEFKRAR
jgi:hypothetical protein